ncbi:MAG: bifunctional DNA-binding transcriptional regulator/O6-methylguanine-DNA methyltransferase Ada [Acidobacteriota bacterium]|nr:bifunctional DNA-binding transcriptional regulator/O6-methylguanine-DNA methyltransferase Ada [Acidobacteriota bacterium]
MMKEFTTKQDKYIDWRWQAVQTKNREFDGVFYTGVQTTGIFCRPSCPAKIPKRQNVLFFKSADDAERAGFRACFRCKPKNEYFPGPVATLIMRTFEFLQADKMEVPTNYALSRHLNISVGHLQKTFKAVLGLSPKEVIDMMRIENFKQRVKESDVTTSLYESGFGSSRSLYEKAGETLGMTPTIYKKGGKDMKINYTIADSRLGKLLVAATEKGICSVSFGDDVKTLKDELKKEFWAASIENKDAVLKDSVDIILKSLNGEKAILNLPLDLQASAFQMRVWSQLRKIPYGETRSYSQIAEQVGNSKAVRAVARACASNPVALITPCHRVIAANGKLSGYRWGIERKQQLLDKENKNNESNRNKS